MPYLNFHEFFQIFEDIREQLDDIELKMESLRYRLIIGMRNHGGYDVYNPAILQLSEENIKKTYHILPTGKVMDVHKMFYNEEDDKYYFRGIVDSQMVDAEMDPDVDITYEIISIFLLTRMHGSRREL